MYEPYLNREKQYLKVNAELDNRFKEIDQMKSDRSEIVKLRLNVFGNGSKVNNQSVRSVIQTPKHKRSEIKCGASSKISGDVVNSNKNALCDPASSVKSADKSVDKTQKLKACATNCSRLSQENDCLSERKLSDHVDTTAIIIRTQIQPSSNNINAAISLPTNDATVKKNISSDGLIKFLKSKVAILKQELELSQQENVKNLRAYEGCVESNKKNIAQMDLLSTENEALKTQVDKLQKANNIYETVVKEKDADMATLNREMNALKKQLKEINRLHNSLEKRFLKCQDDLEHAKRNLNNSQDCERQQRALNHQQKNFFEEQMKTLSKQRTGLISAYKKQLLLIDNLKRQNLCLEQSKLLQVAEKDFVKVLDWNN